MKEKKINKFSDWLNEGKQKINEENLEIQIDWWDQAVVEVMQQLEDECNGFLSMGTLTSFIKTKFKILGRDWDEFSDNLILLHIKDLIFQYHGKSFCEDNANDSNTTLHAKGLAIEQLANAIYDKVVEHENAVLNFDEKQPAVRLADKEPTMLVPMKAIPVCGEDDCCDELPFEKKRVLSYERYAIRLDEAICKLRCDNFDDCVNYCLDTIKKEAGGLGLSSVIDAAENMQKGIHLTEYIRMIAGEYLKDHQQTTIDLMKEKGENGKEIIGQAMDMLCQQIVGEVLDKIENAEEDEEAE